MLDSYVAIAPKVRLVLTVDGLLVYLPRLHGRDDVHQVNSLGEQILRRCGGHFRVREIVDDLVLRFSAESFDLSSEIKGFVARCVASGILRLSASPQTTRVQVSGDHRLMCPTHLSFEVTTRCNLSCSYCYRLGPGEPQLDLDYGLFHEIVPGLSALGVQAVELTGGEPTLHPDFLRLLRDSETYFSAVAVITNGVLLGRLSDALVNQSTALFQVDLNASTSSLHDQIVGVPGAFAATVASIKRAKSNGLLVRVVMNVLRDNVFDMGPTLELARQLGVDRFLHSPILPIGRGATTNVLAGAAFQQYCLTVRECARTYSGFYSAGPREGPGIDGKPENCGAGWRSLTVNPRWDVRVCPMSSEEHHHLGSLLESDYESFLRKASPAMLANKRTQVPGPGVCGDCEHGAFCWGCIIRPWHVQSRLHEEGRRCAWLEAHGVNLRLPVRDDAPLG